MSRTRLHGKYFEMYDQDTLALPEIPEDEMSDIPMFGKAVAFGFTPKGDWYDLSTLWTMPIGNLSTPICLQ